MSERIADLDQQLRDAGLPIEGVARFPDGTVRVDFIGGNAAATPEQHSTAQTIVAAFDWGGLSVPDTNKVSLEDKARAMIADLEAEVAVKATWDGRTAAYRQEVIRRSLLALAKLARLVVNKLDSD